MSVKDCEYPGCERQTPTNKMMCPRHWNVVPYSLQRAVHTTWSARLDAVGRPGYEVAKAEHEKAKRDAIAAVREVVREPGRLR